MKVVTDDGADLSPEEAEYLGVSVVPFFIHFPGWEVASTRISRDAFYERLRAIAPRVPTTSAPSPGLFAEIYNKIARLGEEIISVHITGRMSATAQNARLAAQEVAGNVTVADTLSFSGGQRFQVLAAVLGAKLGWAKEVILERLDRIRAASEVVFSLGTLEYLFRGGRIGRVQALVGSLLQIKPLIALDKADGQFSPAGRARTWPRTLDMIVDYLVQRYKPETPLWLSVLHGQFAEQAQKLTEALQERLKVARLEVLRISPALGVHAGPESVGVAALPIRLMEGLE